MTNDTQAPERIWAAPSPAFGWEDIVGGNYDAGMPGCVQYIRADLSDALIAERVREAVEAEREACAKVAEVQFDERGRSRTGHHSEMDWTDGYRDATRGAAAAIRARAAERGSDGR